MHGTMGGYHEIRVTGPGRRQYRLFCRLDSGSHEQLAQRGFAEPQIVVINGMDKPPNSFVSKPLGRPGCRLRIRLHL